MFRIKQLFLLITTLQSNITSDVRKKKGGGTVLSVSHHGRLNRALQSTITFHHYIRCKEKKGRGQNVIPTRGTRFERLYPFST